MDTIVMKFGGTSVGTIDRIKNVARLIAEKRKSNNVIVAISAMSGETDRLINLMKSLENNYDPREYDVIVSTGEQVSIALVAQALISLGIKAKSFTGWQAKIITDSSHTKSRIKKIETDRLKQALLDSYVCVVAGFQGVSEDTNDITTLGRGGSDTTAVALAAAVNAKKCEIYTDIDGVYTGDPRKIDKPCKLSHISFEEMLELAAVGAKVLHSRSVEIAMKYNLPIEVLSSMEKKEGTIVSSEEEEGNYEISGVAISEEVKCEINLNKVNGTLYNIMKALNDAAIDYDMFTRSNDKVSFYVKSSEKDRAIGSLNRVVMNNNIYNSQCLNKVSVVGKLLGKNRTLLKQFQRILDTNNISVHDLYYTSIRLSFIVNCSDGQKAANLLHDSVLLKD
jgi:aspartate kinase